MKTKCFYYCEVCGEEYPTEAEAMACENLPTITPTEKVGTVVKLKNTGVKGIIQRFKYYRSITEKIHLPEYEILLEDRTSTWRTLKQIEILKEKGGDG